MKIISLDCESNGLGGQAFAVAATVSDEYGEAAIWTARCPITGPTDEWVFANVLPALEDMPETDDDYLGLLTGWCRWYGQVKAAWPDTLVVGHVVWPVETTFLRDAHHGDLFAGPFPLIDVAGVLLAKGHDPTTVDGYLDAHGLPKPEGSPHHPLYDARAAAAALRHLLSAEPVAVEGREP